jgi:hypothetical protein
VDAVPRLVEIEPVVAADVLVLVPVLVLVLVLVLVEDQVVRDRGVLEETRELLGVQCPCHHRHAHGAEGTG